MADLSDVTYALGSIIGSILYPAGAAAEAPSPVVGARVRVEAGWPEEASLRTDLANSKAHVSIYPRPSERVTTRYISGEEEVSRDPPTFFLVVNGQTVTVSGVAPAVYRPQNLAMLVNGRAYIVQTVAGSTSSSLASGLASAMAAIGATAAGNVVTVPPSVRINRATVGATGTLSEEVRRQERDFQIIIWASTPGMRDVIAKALDPALAKMDFITLSDGQAARLMYRGSPITDFDQKQGVFRRDLFYAVEYGTTAIEQATEIVAFDITVIPQVIHIYTERTSTTLRTRSAQSGDVTVVRAGGSSISWAFLNNDGSTFDMSGSEFLLDVQANGVRADTRISTRSDPELRVDRAAGRVIWTPSLSVSQGIAPGPNTTYRLDRVIGPEVFSMANGHIIGQ